MAPDRQIFCVLSSHDVIVSACVWVRFAAGAGSAAAAHQSLPHDADAAAQLSLRDPEARAPRPHQRASGAAAGQGLPGGEPVLRRNAL